MTEYEEILLEVRESLMEMLEEKRELLDFDDVFDELEQRYQV